MNTLPNDETATLRIPSGVSHATPGPTRHTVQAEPVTAYLRQLGRIPLDASAVVVERYGTGYVRIHASGIGAVDLDPVAENLARRFGAQHVPATSTVDDAYNADPANWCADPQCRETIPPGARVCPWCGAKRRTGGTR